MIALDNSPAQTQLPHLAVYIIYMAILHHFLGSGENGLGTKGEDFCSGFRARRQSRDGIGEMPVSG